MKKLFISLVVLLGMFLGAAPAAHAQFELVYNRSELDKVSVPLAVPATGALTLEAWVYYAGATYSGSYNTVLEFDNDAPYFGVTINGNLTLYQSVTGGTVPVQTWTHLAYVWDGTNSRVYINGVQVGSTGTAPAPRTGGSMGIGYNVGDTGWDGSIDEVMVWNSARTVAQLQADALLRQNLSNTLPGSPTGLLAYLKFNEGSGQTTANLVTGGPVGTLGSTTSVELNDPAWTASVTMSNNALAFDGVDDNVSIPGGTGLNLTTALTIETWIKPTGGGFVTQDVICKSSLSQNTGYIFPRTDDTWFRMSMWLNRGGNWTQYLIPYAANVGAWHHVAATYDGTTVRMYVDGVAVTPTINGAGGSGPLTTNTNPLTLGNQPGTVENYRGAVDEARVFNAVLSQAQIQADMFNTAPAGPGNLAYYNFDQGTAGSNNAGLTSLSDLSGNGNAGTLNNFALTGTTSNWVRSFPTITGISPSTGARGSSVVLVGTNLLDATGFAFNGAAVAPFTTPTDDLTATVTVPNTATTGPVSTASATLTAYNGPAFTIVTDLVVNTGTTTSPTPIPAGSYNTITVTSTGNAVLAGNVSVATSFTVQPGGGLSDGCAIISGAGTFTLGAGSILGICNAAGITSSGATGAVQVTGTRSFSTAANYGYNTSAAVTGNGLPATVASLAINTAGNVTLSGPVSVSQAVGVGGAGNLVLNGNALTLLSSASGTALAVNTGTGAVVGAATVQRYIDPSVNPGLGYRHYSAPVSNTTVADLATPTGFSPNVSQGAAYNASATPGLVTPFPNVFGYDQARVATAVNNYSPFDKGFVAPTSLADPLVVGRGYAVNIGASQLVDFVGTLTTGATTVALARNAAASPNAASAGWQLLGNPYPAPLDFAQVTPADMTGLDAAMYVFESSGPYTGTYRSYVNGLPAPNRYVGTAQGFFVRVSAGQTSGSFAFRDAQRVTTFATQVPFRRTAVDVRPLVQLALRGATGPADALYAYAETGATPAYDAAFDAVKLPNSTGLNLSSTATTGESLAIDGRPAFAVGTALPLTVGVPAAGTYTLTAVAFANLPAGLEAFLADAATGQTVNLNRQPAYSFAVNSTQAAALVTGRFVLRFAAASPLATAPAPTAADVTLYPNPAHDQFTALLPAVAGAAQVQGALLNALGQVVRRQTAPATAAGALHLGFDTAGLAAGVYTLRLQAGPVTLVKRVVLN